MASSPNPSETTSPLSSSTPSSSSPPQPPQSSEASSPPPSNPSSSPSPPSSNPSSSSPSPPSPPPAKESPPSPPSTPSPPQQPPQSEASSTPPSIPSSTPSPPSPPPANASPPPAKEPPRSPPSPPSTPSPPPDTGPPPQPPKDPPLSSPPPVTPPPAKQLIPPPSNPPSTPSSSPPPSTLSPPPSSPPPNTTSPPSEPSTSPPSEPQRPPSSPPPTPSTRPEVPPPSEPVPPSPPPRPPSSSPPPNSPPSSSPPTKPPLPFPPSHSPPSNSPPSETPPTVSPPSEAPPTASPPHKSPPPSESPPSFLPPSASPPSLKPPTGSIPPPPSEKVAPIVPSSPNSTNDTGGSISGGAIAGIGVAVTLSLIMVALFLWLVRKKRKRDGGSYPGGAYAPYTMPTPVNSSNMSDSSYPKSPSAPLMKISSEGKGSPGGLGNTKWFSLEELSEVTNAFSKDNLLGEGGFGCVYKGVLHDGREVAVKQLKTGGGQGEREFQAEVEIISRIHHRHLVSLVGYCMTHDQRLLVYEYISNNTLHHHLHGSETSVLDWPNRVKVAVGAARGLAYLHEDCHQRIIHRDIKSSNILLDDSFEARVSDFGLAKLTLDAQTHVTTRVMGTFGYLAPEYASSGKLTDRSDVYSFGVVLLELITGRKPVDQSQPIGDESLVEWARPLMTHTIETKEVGALSDPRLEGNYVELEMFHMMQAAAACVRHSAAKRPTMGKVVRALENLSSSVDLANGVIPGQSETFNSGANSEDARIFQRMAFGEEPFSSDFSRASWISRSYEDV